MMGYTITLLSSDDEESSSEVPTEYKWIKKNVSLNVEDGNRGEKYTAKVKKDPEIQNMVWYVEIKWDVCCRTEFVRCDLCTPMDSENRKRSAPPIKKEPVAIKKERPKLQILSLCSSSESEDSRPCSPVARTPEDSTSNTGEKAAFVTPSANPSKRGPGRPRKYRRITGRHFSRPIPRKLFVTNERESESKISSISSKGQRFKKKFVKAKQIVNNLWYTMEEVEDALAKLGSPFTLLDTSALQLQRMTAGQRTQGEFQVDIGMDIQKEFDDGILCEGIVLYKVKEETTRDDKVVDVWRVIYDDGDEEDLEYHELRRYQLQPEENLDYHDLCRYDSSTGKRYEKEYELAKAHLTTLSYSPKEVEEALEKIGPPYTRLQSAAASIQKSRNDATQRNDGFGQFNPEIGMEVRKPFDGTVYKGMVVCKAKERAFNKIGEEEEVWRVEYEDGDFEDLSYNELLKFRHPQPEISKIRGRPMQALELFCGRGVVSQEFRQRQWKVISLDNDPNSNATLCKDVLDVEPHDLKFVPDFIWASPPCHTYSRMAGARHRSAKNGEFEKSKEARDNNYFFTKMVQFMKWAKSLHPHMIVMIENPVGQLQNMPLMKQFEKEFGLSKVIVDYCAFGRDDQKPTMLWTNDFGLADRLQYFRCAERCCVGGKGHHESIQGNVHIKDFGVIPQPLADEVAAYVSAKFELERILRTKAADPKHFELGLN